MSCASFNSSCLNPSGDPLSTSSQFLPLSFSFLLLTALSILLSVLLPAHNQQCSMSRDPNSSTMWHFTMKLYFQKVSFGVAFCRISPLSFHDRRPLLRRASHAEAIKFLPSPPSFLPASFLFFSVFPLPLPFLPRQPTLSDRSVGRGILFPSPPPSDRANRSLSPPPSKHKL